MEHNLNLQQRLSDSLPGFSPADENKPIWMHAEEREEQSKVSGRVLLFSSHNLAASPRMGDEQIEPERWLPRWRVNFWRGSGKDSGFKRSDGIETG